MEIVSADHESTLAELVSQWQQLRARGKTTTPIELCRERLELLPELERRIAILERMSALNDPLRTVDEPAREPTPPISAQSKPQLIGHFAVERILGQGGFGLVYLARDNQLQRFVAIKVPHRHLVSRPEDAEAYLTEARTVAALDHPNIVPVYEVGSDEVYPIFIVSKYIEGTTLAQRIKHIWSSLKETVEMVAMVAETLHYAHRKGLVHRDIKPGNILLDSSGKPFVADFGLALREQDVGKGRCFAGTAAYMSPEQARGEGHRVDGRSDIFSLGIVFYQLLTGRLPFHADSAEELREQILDREVRPPRQWDDTIPKELERICLRALSKRASERYSTAKDMADDLRHFLADTSVEVKTVHTGQERQPREVPPTLPMPSPTPRDQQVVQIVPKGLRSFDPADADFFLELLPGPRDRDGLPDSIRFWKRRIEKADADDTFAVGLIYGPSGCGKSSLVKAGLLPRLANTVTLVYVEATGGETEARLLKGLRRQFAELPNELGLIQSLAALRQGQFLKAGRKVLLVLDQLEQWLHATPAQEGAELVQAMRQCDGARVQSLILVRDDFWMAATRFLRAVEVLPREGENSAAVDLFDTRHARRVLSLFGRAFGALPGPTVALSDEQERFLDQAIGELAEGGKVIPVRLALFAEMVKAREWRPATLRAVGGAAGIGVTFLEETFSAPTAARAHRVHQKAAEAVLRALLPEAAAELRGAFRSSGELQVAAGYADQADDFADLMRILDGELRMVTPRDPEESRADQGGPAASRTSYQLTHDFLVPPLRQWLTRKQRESRQGRAELRLATIAAIWRQRPQKRVLPSTLEWLGILWDTRRSTWTKTERQMMSNALWQQLLRGATALVLLGALLAGGYFLRERARASSLLQQTLKADFSQLAGLLPEASSYHRWLRPDLERLEQDATSPPRERLVATVLLYRDVPTQERAAVLRDRLRNAELEELSVLCETLATSTGQAVRDELWQEVLDPSAEPRSRLRNACALARLDPDSSAWDGAAAALAKVLLGEEGRNLPRWIELLEPAAPVLVPALRQLYLDTGLSPGARATAAEILAEILGRRDDMAALASLILDADPESFRSLIRKLAPAERNLISREELIHVVARIEPAGGDERSRDEAARRQATALTALFVLGDADQLWPKLRQRPDDRLRSLLIQQLARNDVDPRPLLSRLMHPQADPAERQAILLALAEMNRSLSAQGTRDKVTTAARDAYLHDPDGGVHSAAELVLSRWAGPGAVRDCNRELPQERGLPAGRRWYIDPNGHTFVIIPGPLEFWMGSPEQEEWHNESETRHFRRIRRSLAVATKEVALEQFRAFNPRHRQDLSFGGGELESPVNSVSWYEAARYCNWLSERARIPRDQWCYPESIKSGMQLDGRAVERTGFRLPTEAEWEYLCRAGTETSRPFGQSEELLPRHAWNWLNSGGRSQPVARLLPNRFGLFDILGNMWEWCDDGPITTKGFNYPPYPPGTLACPAADPVRATDVRDDATFRMARGGAYDYAPSMSRAARRYDMRVNYDHPYQGFRVVRTLPRTAEE
jgi:serine/threonine protein kinase/formylglycine-generating enzyme required for sulfatase activity